MKIKNGLAEKIFENPVLYRFKVNIVKFCALLIGKLIFRHKPEALEIFNRNIRDGDSLLDIGCGDGYVYNYLIEKGRKFKFIGCDVNDNMILHCREKYPNEKWISTGKFDFNRHPEKFDVITYHGVLHHMDNFNDIRESIISSLNNSKIVMLYEPIQSDNLLLKNVKNIFWKITDGGRFYLTVDEYHSFFNDIGAKIIYEDYSRPLKQIYVVVIKKA